MLIILRPSAKLKMPSEATTAVRVRGGSVPRSRAAAPASRLTRPRHAHCCVTLCHGSMETLLGLHRHPGRRLAGAVKPAPRAGRTGTGRLSSGREPPRVLGTDLGPHRRLPAPRPVVHPPARLRACLDGADGATRAPRRYSPRCRATRPAWWMATSRPEPFYRRKEHEHVRKLH